MDFKKSETLKNLTRAFAAECQDGAKYQFMADEATQKQMSNVSTVLKALATNEMSHAKVFLDCIKNHCEGGVDVVNIDASYQMQVYELVQMLKIVGKIESKEANEVYPGFANIAEKEGFDDIAKKFNEVAKVEEYHSVIFDKLHKLIQNNQLYTCEAENLWKCYNCGYEEMNTKAWKKCPLCDKGQGYIKIKFDN